jgi:hypothetical protein
MAFDVEGAKKAGYSDADIAAHLAQQSNFDVEGAKKAGYSDTEIVQHLATSAAKPPSAPAPAVNEGIPQPRVPLPFNEATNYVGRMLKNAPESGGKFIGNMYHAITSPLETAGGMADIAAGGLRAAMPEGVRNFIDKLDNPETTKRIADTASQFGGDMAHDYGSPAAIAKKFETDPVGALADLSIIFGGAGGVARRMGATNVGNALTRGAELTNPINALAPVGNKVMSGTQGITNWFNPKNTALIAAGEGRIPEIVNALRQPNVELVPGSVPTSAQAASGVSGTVLPALEKNVSALMPTEYAEQAARNEAARRAALGPVAGTEAELTAAKETRRKTSKQNFEKAGAQTVEPDAALTELMQTPAMQDAINRARTTAENKREPFNLEMGTPAGEVPSKIVGPDGRPIINAVPEVPANITAAALHDVKVQLDKMLKPSTPATPSAVVHDIDAVRSVKSDLVDWLEKNAPGYSEARGAHVELSKPVNRMEVGQFLEDKLKGALGEERGPAFANAAVSPAETIKAVTGRNNLKTYESVLGPEGAKVVESIRADLQREAETAAKAKQGGQAAKEIMPEVEMTGPRALSRIVAVSNDIIRRIGGKIDRKIAMEIAADLLNPTTGANAFETALNWQKRNARIGQAVRGATQATTAPINALTALSTPVNQNALAGQ